MTAGQTAAKDGQGLATARRTMMSLGQHFPDAGEQYLAAVELKRQRAAVARLADTFGIDPATGKTLRSVDRSRLAAHVTAHRLQVGYPVGNGGETMRRHGPWLPNVETAPASYTGSLVYGTGLLFGLYWETAR